MICPPDRFASDAPLPPATAAANPFAGRDRVLLYTRGMDVSPEAGVTLALQSMRQAGENAPAGAVMERLFHILREQYPVLRMADGDGKPLASAPPMNRTSVIAEDMDQFSLIGSFLRWLWALFGAGGKAKPSGHA